MRRLLALATSTRESWRVCVAVRLTHVPVYTRSRTTNVHRCDPVPNQSPSAATRRGASECAPFWPTGAPETSVLATLTQPFVVCSTEIHSLYRVQANDIIYIVPAGDLFMWPAHYVGEKRTAGITIDGHVYVGQEVHTVLFQQLTTRARARTARPLKRCRCRRSCFSSTAL